jgi:hypothetical protein
MLTAERLRDAAIAEARLHYDLGHNHGRVVALVRTARFHNQEALRCRLLVFSATASADG